MSPAHPPCRIIVEMTGAIRARTYAAGLAIVLTMGAAFAADQRANLHPRPPVILNQGHAAKLSGVVDGGISVETLNGGHQIVGFNDIWRIRRAVAIDEPSGSTVIDFAENRIFVATSVADLLPLLDKNVPLVKFTSPNGDVIYMAANKVTDIFRALPGVHNPNSQTVIGTRDGIQQVKEPLDAAQRIVAAARTTN